jgi:hypothetical protein
MCMCVCGEEGGDQDANMPSKSFVPPWRKSRGVPSSENRDIRGMEGDMDDGGESWANIPSAEGDH